MASKLVTRVSPSGAVTQDTTQLGSDRDAYVAFQNLGDTSYPHVSRRLVADGDTTLVVTFIEDDGTVEAHSFRFDTERYWD